MARRIMPLIAAAAVVLVVAIGVSVYRMRGGELTPLRGGVHAMPPAASMPTLAIWGVTRDESNQLPNHARAVLVGILASDLALAIDRKDIEHRRAYLAALAQTIDVRTARDLSTQLEAASSDTTPEAVPFIIEMTREAMRAIDPVVAESAAWLESVRLANAAGDASLQSKRSGPEAIAGLTKGATLNEEQRTAAEHARGVLSTATSSTTDVADAVFKLLRSMAH